MHSLECKCPDLDLQHVDIISCILKQLHDDCKKSLLLHGPLTTLEQLERGLAFYDEQLRVLNFHKEASNAKGFAAFGGDRPEKGEPKGKGGGKDHGKDGGKDKGKGKGKEKGKDKGPKGGGKTGGKDWARSASTPGKKKPGTCNYCHKPGHWAMSAGSTLLMRAAVRPRLQQRRVLLLQRQHRLHRRRDWQRAPG